MFKAVKENPLASIVAVLTIISILCGGVYSMYNLMQKLDEFVTEAELQENTDTISIEILSVAIMRYEDDLGRLEIKVQLDQATALEKAEKMNIERRLSELKTKRLSLGNHTHGQ